YIPQADPIVSTRGQNLAIGREGHIRNTLAMFAKHPHFLARGNVPNMDCLAASRKQRFAIAGETEAAPKPPVTYELLDFIACGKVPPMNRPTSASREQGFAVRRKNNDFDYVLLVFEPAHLFATSCLPETDRVVPASRGQLLAVRRKGQGLHTSVVTF